MTETTYQADVVIFGGGVAGLWLLARLRAAGYQAILLESQALGAGQTRYAQGIIHGGTKYALTGNVSAASEAIAAMPGLWRDCMAGRGEVDLRQVRLMSPHQYLWSTASITSRMAGFFASKMMKSRVGTLDPQNYPTVFRDRGFRGQVYQLEEPVLDTASLIHALAEPQRDAICRVAADAPIATQGDRFVIPLPDNVELHARRLVLTAGRGNAALLHMLGHGAPAMQTRPLKMVMVRGALPEGVYAHCLGASTNPRVTITTHYDAQGKVVWYLGGELSESGVKRSDEEQIAAARAELTALLPWIDFARCQFATLDIDRAEPLVADGRRPDDAYVHSAGGVLTTWPTKLAFAPRLAAQVLQMLQTENIVPGAEAGALPACAFPGYALLPWQEDERWS